MRKNYTALCLLLLVLPIAAGAPDADKRRSWSDTEFINKPAKSPRYSLTYQAIN